jgi:diguanylate cyclase (GGDEF)-like protein
MSDAQSPTRILAVDADDGRQAQYRAAFAANPGGAPGAGFSVLAADCGGKGLPLVQTFRPDCVIVAAALPDMTAAGFIERLGRTDATPGPALVIATSPAEEAAALDALGAGAEDYVVSDRLGPAQLRRAVGRAIEIVSLRRQIVEAKHAASGMGFDDPLTHLATRSLFHNRLVHAVILAKRSDQNVGVMLLELSQLKEINFLLGHDTGDAALREAANRLKTVLREADTVARTSGNQFAVLLQTGATYEGSTIAAQKIQNAMRQPFQIEGRDVDLTPDIGIALFPNHGDNSDTLMHHAEAAMRQARRQGGGYAIFAYDDMLSDFLEAGPSVA